MIRKSAPGARGVWVIVCAWSPGRGGGGGVESRMQMAAGVLQQAGASQVGGSGRPVDVLINVHTQGKRIALKPSRLHVVCEPALLERLGDLIGPEHVQVIAGGNGNGGSWDRR